MTCSYSLLLGRILLSLIFLLAGIGKLLDYENTAKYMAAAGMTMIPFFLYGAAIVEILGALLIILGWKARIGAGILMLFLIPTTLIFHAFWNFSGDMAQIQMIMFMKNLAIFGGLLYIVGAGPGKYSLDCLSCCSKTNCSNTDKQV